MERRPALFLDRDGVINVDRGYVASIADFEWTDGAADCIARFNARGWFVFVVTNQTGIAHGLYSEADMDAVHAHMTGVLAEKGVQIDRIYHCPFDPKGTVATYTRDSRDRKPHPGMLLQAMADFPVIREASFLIGDKETDLQAARAAGVGGFLFKGGNLNVFADWALAAFEDGAR